MDYVTDFWRSLISIHERHIAVHEDQFEVTPFEGVKSFIVWDVFLYYWKGFLSVCSLVANISAIYFHRVFENNDQGIDIEYLIVYDQNLLVPLLRVNNNLFRNILCFLYYICFHKVYTSIGHRYINDCFGFYQCIFIFVIFRDGFL